MGVHVHERRLGCGPLGAPRVQREPFRTRRAPSAPKLRPTGAGVPHSQATAPPHTGRCSAACAAAGGATCTGSHESEDFHRMHISELRVTHQRPPWDRFRRRSRIRPLNRCQTNAKSRKTEKVDLGINFGAGNAFHTRQCMYGPGALPVCPQKGFSSRSNFWIFRPRREGRYHASLWPSIHASVLEMGVCR